MIISFMPISHASLCAGPEVSRDCICHSVMVPGEGHMVIKQGNLVVISKSSHMVIKARTHVPVVRGPGVFKDNLW